MDQKELRTLENRCIEENPPWCVADCPLHVDARTLAVSVAKGDWAGAWKVLLRSMPFPGILGRICDAPCQEHCKRADSGGAIAIGDLERACVSHRTPMRPSAPLPAKEQRVAILGAGLAGLTAAWDLTRKGYQMTVYEPGAVLAASLRERYSGELEATSVEEELALLEKLGVRIELNAPAEGADFLERFRAEYNAVFLSLDVLDQAQWPLERGAEDRPFIASPAQATLRKGVFAGGLDRPNGPSPVWQAAEGRWAATSIDRFLQGVSPTAGREKEGPCQTRLFTSLDGLELEPVVKASGGGYSDEEAMREAARCLQCHCLECVKVCPYLETFKGYPKKYAREIYNNQSIVMGERKSNKLINSCSLCGLCEEVCPHDFAMQDLCLAARREMVQKGKMPPSAHEFALLDMESSLSPDFRLARHQPGHETSARIFYPGCQLAASNPAQVRAVYDHLCAALPGGVGIMLSCCGAPALWAGQEEKLSQSMEAWQEDWQSLGAPRVIMACPSCRDVFKKHLPQVEQVFLWDVLQETRAGQNTQNAGTYAMHDPCAARHDSEAQESVRIFLSDAEVTLKELRLGRELTECCGYGGLMYCANPELADETVRRRGEQSPLDYITYCAVCRDRLAASGKRAVHALDIVFPADAQDDPAARPNPGWSQRRENRARLKAELLRDLWQEEVPEMEAHRELKLMTTPQVDGLLEKRRILIEDLQKVIFQAEKNGDKLTHPETGHFLASFQPYKAVFWVEYSPTPEGFAVHNAYSHRMTVKAGGRP
jgi:glutamate synthase (NADPH/NADH) small chain